jgi:hypothetical protein
MATRKQRTNNPKLRVTDVKAITSNGAHNDKKEVPVESAAEEHIAALAYEFWKLRGRPIGSPEEDWFRAEKQLNQGEPLFSIHKSLPSKTGRTRNAAC